MKITVKERRQEYDSEYRSWGQISWRRLAEEILSSSGELLPNEEIVEFEVSGEELLFEVRLKK